MTNKEAIRIIKIVLAIAEDFEITVQGEELTEEKCKEAVEIVTKALEQQPCEEYNYKALWEQVKWERDVATEQLEQLGYSLGEKIRTSEDCISREQAVYVASGYCAPQNIADELRKLPSVTPQTKRGKWIVHEDGGYDCSNCCEHFSYNHYHYCPCCGSQNREVDG